MHGDLSLVLSDKPKNIIFHTNPVEEERICLKVVVRLNKSMYYDCFKGIV